jgi:hypothetical protein
MASYGGKFLAEVLKNGRVCPRRPQQWSRLIFEFASAKSARVEPAGSRGRSRLILAAQLGMKRPTTNEKKKKLRIRQQLVDGHRRTNGL